MSLRPIDDGGYGAYFQSTNKVYSIGSAQPLVEIQDSCGWAGKYMKLARFRQIRGAFHAEDKSTSRGCDKCHQLRKMTTAISYASRRCFRVTTDLAFDEGGGDWVLLPIPMQYNKDKSQKFRVDFFILASSSTYAILHLDVYQGRNSTNS